MRLSELKSLLATTPEAMVHLMLPSGEFVPAHYHITEVARLQKDFIDCGGTRRAELRCVLQVWVALDTDHRISAGRFHQILSLADDYFTGTDPEVGVEYDAGLVSEFPLGHAEVTPRGVLLELGKRATDCLAPDRCGIPVAATAAGCAPGGGCC